MCIDDYLEVALDGRVSHTHTRTGKVFFFLLFWRRRGGGGDDNNINRLKEVIFAFSYDCVGAAYYLDCNGWPAPALKDSDPSIDWPNQLSPFLVDQ